MVSIHNCSFFEAGCDFINLINETSADADFDTDWIKLTHYNRALIIIKKLGATDVDTLGFQFLQGTTAAGGSAKALNVSRYWTKQGTMTSQGTWTQGVLTTPDDIVGIGSAAPSGGSLIVGTDVNTDACIVAIDIQATDLDADNGFDWIAVRVEGDEINEAALISIDAILTGGRFPQIVPLSAIA
jgi:hypothetical protein